MQKVAVMPKNYHQPVNNAYSHAIKVDNVLYIAGQVPLDDQGRVVGVRDMRKQATQVFKNIGRILKEVGAGFDNIVKWNGYMIDMDHNFPAYAEVRSKYFSKNPKPAATLVEVKSLALREFLLEIEAIAVLD